MNEIETQLYIKERNIALDDAMKAAASIANEANFLWNDNINSKENLIIRDTAWKIYSEIKKLKM